MLSVVTRCCQVSKDPSNWFSISSFRDNNRTRSASVVSRNDHSYIHLFPDDTSSNKGGKKDQDRGKGRRRDSLEDEEEGAEPDTVTDDLVS